MVADVRCKQAGYLGHDKESFLTSFLFDTTLIKEILQREKESFSQLRRKFFNFISYLNHCICLVKGKRKGNNLN